MQQFNQAEEQLIRDMVENGGQIPYHEPSWQKTVQAGFQPKTQDFNRQLVVFTVEHYGVSMERMVHIANEVTAKLNPSK